MARDKVEITGTDTKDLETLPNDEMNELFEKMKKGDKFAKEKISVSNLKLVLSILKRFRNKNEDIDDLFQIGCVGLVKAIDNFDLSYEVKFSTYAVPMIEGEIRRYVRDNNQVKISRSIRELTRDILSFKEEFLDTFSRYPTNDEICEGLKITPYELSVALQSLIEPMSIFEPIYNDGGDTIFLVDQIEDKRDSMSLDDNIALKKAIEKLKDKEKEILIKRYFIGSSQTEIASNMGISQAQVSRLENSALNNIRKLIL